MIREVWTLDNTVYRECPTALKVAPQMQRYTLQDHLEGTRLQKSFLNDVIFLCYWWLPWAECLKLLHATRPEHHHSIQFIFIGPTWEDNIFVYMTDNHNHNQLYHHIISIVKKRNKESTVRRYKISTKNLTDCMAL